MSDSQAISVYTDLVNRGALTYPSNEWVDNVTLMYDIFNTHHGSKVYITINLLFVFPVQIFKQKSISERFNSFSKLKTEIGILQSLVTLDHNLKLKLTLL